MRCVYQAWPIKVSNQAGIRYGVCTRFDPLKYQTMQNSSGPIWHLHHGTLVLAQTSSGSSTEHPLPCMVFLMKRLHFVCNFNSDWLKVFISSAWDLYLEAKSLDTYRQTKHTAVRWFSFSPTLPVKNPELKDDLPLQPGIGPNIATHASPTASKFFVLFLISWSVRFNVFPNLIPNFQLH